MPRPVLIWAIVFAATAAAQIPGTQGPFPGPQGPIPPTGPQRPGQGPPVITLPRIPGTARRRPQPRPDAERMPTMTTAPIKGNNTGILRDRKPKQITIETDDHRVIWYRLADNVQVDKEAQDASIDDFALGDRLLIAHAEDDLGQYTAVTVHWVSAATGEASAAAERQWDLPTIGIIEEKDERPRLTRAPKPKEPEIDPDVAVPPNRPLKPEMEPPAQAAPPDAVIEQARAAADEFGATLPGFSVRQLTTRYLREFARNDWTALDMVTANLRYREGTESYSDITVGGKKTDQPMEDIAGARSTGEFYSLLGEILNPGSGAVYTRSGRDVIRARNAWKYRYEITRERSRFRIVTPSQLYYSAHRGTLWIDAETLRVLRIEQEAVNLPPGFPFDTSEVAVDYDVVRLERPFLLPISAEMLYCVRSTTACFRNHTDFRNYVKFDAESGIVFPDAGNP